MIGQVIRRTITAAAVVAVPLAVPASAAGGWTAADLSRPVPGRPATAPVPVSNPSGYETNLTGQGPVVRTVYQSDDGSQFNDGSIIELSRPSGGTSWHVANLT